MSAASILLIDDDPNTPLLLRHALPKAGFKGAFRTLTRADEVTTLFAGSGASAEILPDFVFVDLLLSDGHGFDVLRLIRSDPRGAGIFTAALSCSSHRDDIEGAFSLGADAYVEKYPSVKTLASLREASERQERGRQLCFLQAK